MNISDLVPGDLFKIILYEYTHIIGMCLWNYPKKDYRQIFVLIISDSGDVWKTGDIREISGFGDYCITLKRLYPALEEECSK